MKKINEKEYVLRQSIIDAALALEKKKLIKERLVTLVSGGIRVF
jgi:hypothetical protein